jgi:SAM-dependent methyltransferase
MAEQTRYFPERFKIASQFYTTGRPTYPRLLSRRVAAAVGVSSGDSVLDLGTGPGFLAIDFAPLVKSVTAVDPAAEMLAVANENVARAGVGNVRVVRGASFELGPELGRFKLVTIGRAFHWMDRVETVKALDPLIERAGAIALFGESYPEVPANAWYPEFQAIIDSYSTADPARPQIRVGLKNEAVLLDSAFGHLERLSVLERRDTPVERFVDRALSFASTWAGRPGSREEDLVHEIRAAITKHANSEGLVHEVLEGHALIARRPLDLAAN